ncbi:MAG: AGE family epimerase/isomerase [Neomegalonema sp.]|nr:AGE family epimerase/isomerase [Neomegalonema sp.]
MNRDRRIEDTDRHRDCTARIAVWLKNDALPLWMEQGLCPVHGGFVETLDLKGNRRSEDIRRVRVQFRQIYVFCHAQSMGLTDRGLEVARQGFEYVWQNAWAPNGEPGWAHKLNPDGSAHDPKRDTYDHAFAVFGLAWYLKVSHDSRARFAIEETLRFLEERLRAGNGGWVESDEALTKVIQRRQNPHMHAFEASMALYEHTKDPSALESITEQLSLFKAHFYDPIRHRILEFFNQDWSPVAPMSLQRLEPGHMVEWVYLLRTYEKNFGLRLQEEIASCADALYEKALEIGYGPEGKFFVDELYLDNTVSRPSRRFWPQLELLKAHLVQYRAHGRPIYRERAEALIDAIFDEYLSDCPPGGWRDTFTLDGKATLDNIPASTFYHIFNAFALALEILEAPAVVTPSRSLFSAPNSILRG